MLRTGNAAPTRKAKDGDPVVREKKMMKLFLYDKWVPRKRLVKAIGAFGLFDHYISRLRKVGYSFKTKTEKGKIYYQLVLTEEELAAFPVEINDCGKVTMVQQKELEAS